MQAGVFWAIIQLHVAGQIRVSIVGSPYGWADLLIDANSKRAMNQSAVEIFECRGRFCVRLV